jgi:hypothetical protein
LYFVLFNLNHVNHSSITDCLPNLLPDTAAHFLAAGMML